MSEQNLQGSLINSELIASLAARTALETPGVLRLEPTIKGFLASLGPAALANFRSGGSQDSSYRHDGISVRINDGTARVQLDIATDVAYTAMAVADSVQQRVREIIQHSGLTSGPIHIHILSIEPCSGPTPR